MLLKVQETAWSANYGKNKTYNESNSLLDLGMGQTNTFHLLENNQ